MRIIGDDRLLRVEKDEWEKVRDRLLSRGYVMQSDGGKVMDLWTPDGTKKVSGRDDRKNDCYWLDACVLADLGSYGLAGDVDA